MNYRYVSIRAILSILTVILFLNSSIIVNVNGPGSNKSGDAIIETQAASLTSRAIFDNIKNFADFSAGTCVENTLIDSNGHVSLSWDLPQSPYINDENTLLLSHFDNTYNGADGEKRIESFRSYKDLVGLWKLDEGIGTSTFDSSVNDNHGTINNGATWVEGKIGKALSFDGVDDYISIGSGVSSTIGNQITVSAWVYSNILTQSSTYRAMVTEAYDGDGNVEFELFLSGSKHVLSAGFFDGSWHLVSEGIGFTFNKWIFVTATYDGHYIRIYRDGTEVASSSDLNRALPSGTNGWRIGRRHDQGTPSDMWNGKIDDVSIYRRTKTADEIKADYINQPSQYISFDDGKFSKGVRIKNDNTLAYSNGLPIDSDCAGYWSFDEGSGNIANDSSGNNNKGILINGPKWVNGKFGSALQFDGINDWVDCGNDLSLAVGGGDFTVSAWVNFPGGISLCDLVGKRDPGTSIGWVWHVTPTWTRLWTHPGSGGINYNYDLNYNTWYHIALVRDRYSSKVTYYINGEKKITLASEIADLSNIGKLAIGRLSEESIQYFKGKIDEVAIFNSVKSPEEIYRCYINEYNLDLNEGSIELWVKPNWDGSDGKNHTIFFSGKSWDNDSIFIFKDSDNYLKFLTSDNESNNQGFPKVDVRNWRIDNWYHLVFIWDYSGNKKIYIDGHLKKAVSNNPMPTNAYSSIYIGSTPEVFGSIDGVIDELRISDKVRSADEICQYHALGFYESSVFDAGDIVAWEKLDWLPHIKSDTNIYLQTRISDDNTTWTNWSGNTYVSSLDRWVYTDNTGETINADFSQFIQWRTILTSTDGMFSPALEKVNISWNNLPKASNVKITPAQPTVNDDLIINYEYSDADNEVESAKTKIEWYVKRGSDFVFSGYTGQTLIASRIARGERWFCRVTPHDGRSYGLHIDSNTVTIIIGPIAKIEVTPGNVTITTDEHMTFSAKAYDSAGNEINTQFIWNVTGGGIIDQTGKFEPETVGVQRVYATAGDITGYAVVEVLPGALVELKIVPDNPTITTDEMIEFEVLALDAKGNKLSDYLTTWSVTGGGIIDPVNGTFDAMTVGEWLVIVNVTIVKIINETGNILYNNKSAHTGTKLIISPGWLDRITLEPINPEITADSELQFTATGYDQDDNILDLDFNWLVENGTITSSGLFKPSAVGNWMISVFYFGSEVTVSTNVKVLVGSPNKLIIEPTQKTLEIGESFSFSVKCIDIKGNSWGITEGISWSVSDLKIGEVDTTGKFNALTAGEVTLQATLTNATGVDKITGTAYITVTGEAEFEETKEELEETQELKKVVEEQNILLIGVIVILIIIILILFFLLSRSRRKEEKEERMEDEAAFEKQPGEPEGEEPGEPEEWKLESEEQAPEEVQEDIEEGGFELELRAELPPEEPAEKPIKGKIPIKGKMPKKGKMPVEKKKIHRQKVLKPAIKGKRPPSKPKLQILDKAVKCNVCLGFVKPGLNVITCLCGKHYHENCAERIVNCPACETSLSEPIDLTCEEE